MKDRALVFLFFFGISSCKSQKMTGVRKYYKDFHFVNVVGINEIKSDSLVYPYVEIITTKDSSRQVVFHKSAINSCKKSYTYEKGMLVSRYKYKLNDAGCTYFTELQYYFEKGKMISYVFCGDADFNKNNVYKVYCEGLSDIDTPYEYQFKSTVLHSFGNKTKASITFTPAIDFNGQFFSEVGALVNESTFFNKKDSLCEISKSYTIQKDMTREYISDINYTSPIKKGSISIWRNLDCNTGF